jgi:hypothetical protein
MKGWVRVVELGERSCRHVGSLGDRIAVRAPVHVCLDLVDYFIDDYNVLLRGVSIMFPILEFERKRPYNLECSKGTQRKSFPYSWNNSPL